MWGVSRETSADKVAAMAKYKALIENTQLPKPDAAHGRVMFTQTWERSSRFRYGIVIVVAALLAVCAVVVGFSFVR